jgi:hypothetical protein
MHCADKAKNCIIGPGGEAESEVKEEEEKEEEEEEEDEEDEEEDEEEDDEGECNSDREGSAPALLEEEEDSRIRDSGVASGSASR